MASFRILWRAIQQWSANQDSRMAAALAYYVLFSIAPLILIAIYMAGAIFGSDEAQGQVQAQLQKYIGPESARVVQGLVNDAARNRKSTWGPGVSITLLLLTALGAFVHLRASLSTIWKIEPPHGNTFLGVIVDYGLSVAMVILTGLLLLASVLISMTFTYIRSKADEFLHGNGVPWEQIDFAISIAFLTIAFVTIYRILSGGRIPWRYVLYGSVITAVLFTVGKSLLSFYVVYSGMESAFGAAGSLVVFLMWVYYSAQLLFFGAELIQARRTRHEWMQRKPAPASEPEASPP